jgi:hypothetical protein
MPHHMSSKHKPSDTSMMKSDSLDLTPKDLDPLMQGKLGARGDIRSITERHRDIKRAMGRGDEKTEFEEEQED